MPRSLAKMMEGDSKYLREYIADCQDLKDNYGVDVNLTLRESAGDHLQLMVGIVFDEDSVKEWKGFAHDELQAAVIPTANGTFYPNPEMYSSLDHCLCMLLGSLSIYFKQWLARQVELADQDEASAAAENRLALDD